MKALASLTLLMVFMSSSMAQVFDKERINAILNDPDLAGYAISCRNEDGSYNALKINAKGQSIDCPKGSNKPLNIEVINADLVSAPPIGKLLKEAAAFFKEHDYFLFQCNQLMLDGKSILVFAYYPKKEGEDLTRVLFE